MNNIAIPGLLQEVRRYGRFDVNACLSCGSCTIVCHLSNGAASFPRRPIRRALLGLKGSLLAGLEPWLCHDCGDCSAACPRQAEPRESMMTLRRYLAAQYDFTGLTAKIFTSPVGEIVALSLVGLLVFALALVYHLYYVELGLSDILSIAMGMEHMFPLIGDFTLVVFLIPAFILMINAVRMYRFTMAGNRELRIPFRLYLAEAKTMIVHLLSHQNIRKCVQEIYQKRWVKHWLLGLAITVKCVIVLFFLSWFQTDGIYPLYHPQRWLGYLIAAALIVVPVDILISRIRKRVEMHKFSEPSDLIFPVMLLLVALSGLAVHIFRYLEFSLTAHFAYAVHVALAVPLVIIELPFGKWSHVIYRPLALYFQAVKERALADVTSSVKRELSEGLISTIGAQTA